MCQHISFYTCHRAVTRAVEEATLNGRLSQDEAGPEGPSPSWLRCTLQQRGWCQGSDAWLMLRCPPSPLGTSPASVKHQKITDPSWKQKKAGGETGKYRKMSYRVHLCLVCDYKTKPKAALMCPAPLPSLWTPHAQSLSPPSGPERHNETISYAL